MAKTTQLNEYEDNLTNEWKYVAMVLDNFLFNIFIIVVIIGTAYYFVPYGKDIWNARGFDMSWNAS